MTVYIVTRNRFENLRKVVPRWLAQNIRVCLVVERSEFQDHKDFVESMRWDKATVIHPESPDRGVGHARRYAVTHASRNRLKTMIMSDDDIRPALGSNMNTLLRAAESNKVLGIGAVRPLHDHFSGGVTARRSDLILCPGGWGMQLFALNVANTMSIGSFDSNLDCWGEDHELMRKGIRNGMPWLVHCGVRCESIGKRYEPGGLNSYIGDDDRSARELVCRTIIHNRWPNYVSAPDSRPRTQWVKMMDDYIPGWRTLSAMHGGRWLK